MATTFSRMFQRRGTAAQWAANSTIVLAEGEFGAETDTGQMKIGDGFTQYGSLTYVGAGLGVPFASSAEVLTGTVSDKAVAPDTLATNYPRRAVGAVDSAINNIWAYNNQVTFNGLTLLTVAPRAGVSGVNDITNRAYIDTLFAGQVSGGSADVNKAPILNSNGQLDTSYISSEALPKYLGLFSPVTGIPTLQNVVGGGITPAANNGDYFIASASGFYNFDTGTPGAGTTVTQGAQIIFFDVTNTWSVVDPPGTSFDPGALRKDPTNNSESTILPVTDAVSNLTLQNRISQTVDLVRWLDSGGVQIGGVSSLGILNALSANVERVSSTADSGADYPDGFSNSYVTAASGWPIDGVLLTLKNSNTDVYQMIFNQGALYSRRFTGTWSTWFEYAPQASPTFTGIPQAPTATLGNNTQQLATTAFVQGEKENIPTATQGDADLSAANTRFTTEMVNPVAIAEDVTTLSAQPIGTYTIIYSAEDTDLNSAYNAATGEFTVPTNGAGIYHIHAALLVNANVGNPTLDFQCYVNGVFVRRFEEVSPIANPSSNKLTGSVILSLSDADIVTIRLTVSGLVTDNVQIGLTGNTISNWLMIQRVGAPLLIA